MSVEEKDEDVKQAQDFLNSFVERSAVYTDVENVPKQSFSMHCSKEEIQGECLHIALEYLRESGAPEILATMLAHQATAKVLEQDLNKYEDTSIISSSSEDTCENIAAYDCGKLALAICNTVNIISQEWCKNIPVLKRSGKKYEVYAHSEQNSRRKMEDKHMILTEFNNLFGLDMVFPSQAYFAVFDGHGGVDCANYTVTHFHNNIARQEMFLSDLDEALAQAFLTTDKMFLDKARTENLRAGTTGVVAMLRDNTLHIGWVGDSQVTMCKQGRAVQLMEPHKPNRKDERERIEELGGCVIWIGDWRVNGNIAVSRSIGDKDHKPYVTANPDTLEFDLEGDEEYLILACDGLWDTISPPDVIKIVQKHLENGGARCEVSKILVDRAISEGSTDNITMRL